MASIVSAPTEANPEATSPQSDSASMVLGVLLIVDFLLTVVMLATDKNLQTDFGSQSAYYSHWYGVLVMGLVDLVGALVVLMVAAPSMRARCPSFLRRNAATVALGWSVLAILAMVGIVETYSAVGFPSASEFAKYLFGVSAYPGAGSYIPWLYDALLVAYVVTAIVAAMAMMRGRRAGA
jgi:hypothetical protein